jgi:AAA+ superfamily predicted ATPase
MYQTSGKLAEMGIRYLNSVMLYGKSGTGKTMFGRYLAYKLGMPFAYLNFSHVISSYLGGTGKNISKAFDFVQSKKCVFMLDEMDTVCMRRGKEDVGEMARITIGIMQALDLISNDTVIIGATNRPDMIDDAIKRRFSLSHEICVFTPDEKIAMVRKLLDDIHIAYDPDDVEAYCTSHTGREASQAVVMNNVIRAVAKAVKYIKPVSMMEFID